MTPSGVLINRFALPGICLALLVLTGCHPPGKQAAPNEAMRDINSVLADHDDELLKVPGVQGVYVGLLPDGTTPCLTVIVSRKDPSQAQRIPRQIEGHPVIVEVTDEIRPMTP